MSLRRTIRIILSEAIIKGEPQQHAMEGAGRQSIEFIKIGYMETAV